MVCHVQVSLEAGAVDRMRGSRRQVLRIGETGRTAFGSQGGLQDQDEHIPHLGQNVTFFNTYPRLHCNTLGFVPCNAISSQRPEIIFCPNNIH